MTDARSAISEADLPVKMTAAVTPKIHLYPRIKIKVNLRTRLFLRMTVGFVYWTRLDACISIYGRIHNVHVL